LWFAGSASRSRVDRRLEDASATLGLTLPLSLPGVIAGMILSFARSMREFGPTITFVSHIPGETHTPPSAISTLTQVLGGDAGALRLTLISIVTSMLAPLMAEFVAR
jgi:molybdate transport system permease protein